MRRRIGGFMPVHMPHNFPSTAATSAIRGTIHRVAHIPWTLFGFLAFSFGLAMYFFGVMLVFPRYLLGLDRVLYSVSEWLVWYSGLPLVGGLALMVVDLLVLVGMKRAN